MMSFARRKEPTEIPGHYLDLQSGRRLAAGKPVGEPPASYTKHVYPERDSPFSTANLEAEDRTADIEADIRALAGTRAPTPLPMPEYVQHDPNANQIAQMTGQALAMQYEQSAKAVEEMANRLIGMAATCNEEAVRIFKENEAFKAHMEKAIEDCTRTAQAYREKAAAIFKTVQGASILAEEVSRTCNELQQRISASAEAKAGADDTQR